MQDAMQARLESFRAPRNRSQWIVDFMGNSSGEKANASQLLVANHFLRSFSDLVIEVPLNA